MESELRRLDVLVGAWKVTTSLGEARAGTVFEWALDGRFLVQRSTIDVP